MKRRDGAWHVAQPVDLARCLRRLGPLALEWKCPEYVPVRQTAKPCTVTGTMKNTSDRLGFVVSVGGYIADAEGRTLSTSTQPPPGSPFLEPGEEAISSSGLRASTRGRRTARSGRRRHAARLSVRPAQPISQSCSNAVSVEPREAVLAAGCGWPGDGDQHRQQPGRGARVCRIARLRGRVPEHLGIYYAGTLAPEATAGGRAAHGASYRARGRYGHPEHRGLWGRPLVNLPAPPAFWLIAYRNDTGPLLVQLLVLFVRGSHSGREATFM